jgi:hypothetical protein
MLIITIVYAITDQSVIPIWPTFCPNQEMPADDKLLQKHFVMLILKTLLTNMSPAQSKMQTLMNSHTHTRPCW